jgi:hypothetical protein
MVLGYKNLHYWVILDKSKCWDSYSSTMEQGLVCNGKANEKWMNLMNSRGYPRTLGNGRAFSLLK